MKENAVGNPFTGLASIGANFASDVQNAADDGKFKVHKIIGDGRCMFRATVCVDTCSTQAVVPCIAHLLYACAPRVPPRSIDVQQYKLNCVYM